MLLSRRLAAGAVALLPTYPAWAQKPVPTVGFLAGGTIDDPLTQIYRESMLKGLANAGFVAPRSMRWIEGYGAPGDPSLENEARRLLAEGADIVLAPGAATRAAIKGIAGRIPVLYSFSGDPVAAGFAESLARPLSNATGVTLMWIETNAKRIQLLKELVRSMRRLGLISNPNHPGEAAEIEHCRQAVASLGVDLLYMPVWNRLDVEKACERIRAEKADAVVAIPDAVTLPNRSFIAQWAIERQLPFAAGWSLFAESGALLSYGANIRWGYMRVGEIAARVLNGAKAAALPVEQPTRFELVINLRTAAAVGIDVPASIRQRADDVIE